MTSSEIKELRASLGVSRSALARFLCVTNATIARWEDSAPATGLPLLVLELLRRALSHSGPQVVAEIVRGSHDLRRSLAKLFRITHPDIA